MPLRLAVVTPFFNPHHSRVRVVNHQRFVRRMRELGADVFTVECYVPGFGHSLNCDRLWSFHIRDTDMFWHKEALINAGVKLLPPIYDAVVWSDADLLPLHDNWLELTRQALDRYPLVQAWSTLHSMNQHGRIEDMGLRGSWRTRSLAAVNAGRLQVTTSVVDGAPGGILAARREIFEQMGGLYDRGIAGGGDMLLMFAAYGSYVAFYMHQFTPEMATDARRWGEQVFSVVEGRIGHVEFDIAHLWHGDVQHRQYQTRYRPLRELRYDPRVHIDKDSAGMLHWSTQASASMITAMRSYIFGRHES